MSTEISLNSNILEGEEKYLCLLYGKKKCDSIDYTRSQMLLAKHKQLRKKGSENETILKIKKPDGSSWLPCSRVFVQRIKRIMFVPRR